MCYECMVCVTSTSRFDCMPRIIAMVYMHAWYTIAKIYSLLLGENWFNIGNYH